MTRPPTHRPRRRAVPAVAALAAVATVLAGLVGTGPAAGAAPATAPVAAPAGTPAGRADLGPQVLVFDPSMPTAEIQAAADRIAAQQVDDEMGTGRWSMLFLPGTYGTDEEPLQIQVGYYTEVAGLGASPSDVVINGKVEVYNRCRPDGEGGTSCIALDNFWRTLSNLTIDVNGTGQDGCRQTANFWAASQAASLRRVDVVGGTLSLMDYCTAGPQFASGGFLADSRAGEVVNGSQQQYLTRNAEIGSWSNGVWNQVFSGVVGAPDDTTFPDPPYTTLDETPVSREKPYLVATPRGGYAVRVPDAARDTRGPSWTGAAAPGRTIPLSRFHVARPGEPVRRINRELARGRHLLLTPGLYDVARPIEVRRPGTVVLGMGHATLTAVDGAVPMRVRDRAGTVVAGVTIDAGEELSPTLLAVGRPRGGEDRRRHDGPRRSSAKDPLTLSDVYFRVGGPHVGKADVSMRVDADHVLVDHTWVWRADHGVEDFTAGVRGDTDRWNTNIGRTGVVVTGDHVTATGLFVEHYQRFNTVWRGEHGRVVLYQNELPYDPPTQADWQRPDGTLGWAGYKVADDVRRHELWGGGSYVFNRNNPDIVSARGFEVPVTRGVRMHHLLTVNLDAGTIRHVVNDTGDQVDATRSGQPSYVPEFP
ncbi:Exo-beta-1,3-glucanase [Nocardioides aquaticus]|uniref:Exo-beta-1,3-glucanase n=2 Tax=Nocardioides aquaticus TaxID=160826 RepID=A0ABX8EMA4_9ACTN|nr:hypothetical protein [Nocardioides aquaticus]QVT80960.1 Exo-beta-1,3-glucanase [Nocardioides aquaticus]